MPLSVGSSTPGCIPLPLTGGSATPLITQGPLPTLQPATASPEATVDNLGDADHGVHTHRPLDRHPVSTGNCNVDRYCHGNVNRHRNVNRDANIHCHRYVDRHRNVNRHGDIHRHRYTDRHGDVHCHTQRRPPRTSTSTATAVSAPLTITLVADTYAQEANPSQNYGSDAQLWVTFGTGSSQQSYLKFTVSGAAGLVQSATLTPLFHLRHRRWPHRLRHGRQLD